MCFVNAHTWFNKDPDIGPGLVKIQAKNSHLNCEIINSNTDYGLDLSDAWQIRRDLWWCRCVSSTRTSLEHETSEIGAGLAKIPVKDLVFPVFLASSARPWCDTVKCIDLSDGSTVCGDVLNRNSANCGYAGPKLSSSVQDWWRDKRRETISPMYCHADESWAKTIALSSRIPIGFGWLFV